MGPCPFPPIVSDTNLLGLYQASFARLDNPQPIILMLNGLCGSLWDGLLADLFLSQPNKLYLAAQAFWPPHGGGAVRDETRAYLILLSGFACLLRCGVSLYID